MRGQAMTRVFFTAIFLSTLTSQAFALTGAELIQADARYARGYLWGALTSYLIMVSPDDNSEVDKLRSRRLTCVVEAKINDATFHQAVVAYINRNPTALTEEALGPMIRTLIEMCDR